MDKTQTTKESIDIKPAEIDLDVLSVLSKECAISAIDDEKEMRRLELNCLCEMISEMKHFHTALDETLNVLSIAGNDKIVEFFTTVRENMERDVAEVVKGTKEK